MIEKEPKKIDELVEVLADRFSRDILVLTRNKEYSALQISRELDIPLATVYRKLKRMQDAGLIQHVKTIIGLQGNEERFYRAAVNGVTLNFNGDGVSVEVMTVDYPEKFVRLWKRLKYPSWPDTESTKG